MRRAFAGQDAFEPGSGQERAAQRLRSSGADPTALLQVLDSVIGTPVEQLDRIQVPTLVAVGDDDERVTSVDQLVAALPRGTRAVVPGDHRTTAAAPEFVAAIVHFLAENT
jgi:pimeloyl-ACP methyl ester carboxylesterase